MRFKFLFLSFLFLAQALHAQPAPSLRINAAGVVLRPDGSPSGLSLVDGEIRGNGSFLTGIAPYEARQHDIRAMSKVLTTTLSGLTGISGATYNARSGTLFLIKNDVGSAAIYEVSKTGEVLRTITQTNFEDTEAIKWILYDSATASDVFLITEENPQQRLTLARLTPAATTLDRSALGNITAITGYGGGTLANLGIEAICYDSKRGRVYYTVEKRTGATQNVLGSTNAAIYQRTITPNGTLAFGSESLLCTILPLYDGTLTDISDLEYDPNQDNLLVLSDESDKVVRISRAGALLEEFPVTGYTQPEGLTMHPSGAQLWVVGETNEFGRYLIGGESDDTANLGGSITDRGVVREVWINVGTDGTDEVGDARNPYRVSTAVEFDTILRDLAGPTFRVNEQVTPLKIHLGPGTFLTQGAGWSDQIIFPGSTPYTGSPVYHTYSTGWFMYRGWELHGAGQGATTIQLVSWPFSDFYSAGYPGKHSVVAARSGWWGNETGYTVVKDLTVDCNWANITGKPVAPEAALLGVVLIDEGCLIENVHVKNGYGFYGVLPRENFPVCIGSTDTGPLTGAPYNYPNFSKPGGNGTIRNVRVTGMTGDYTSAIVMFSNGLTGAGGLIENCLVEGPNIQPSAYQVTGRGHRIINCKAINTFGGFSVDTGPIEDILIQGMQCIGITGLGIGLRTNPLVINRMIVRDSFFEVVPSGAAAFGTNNSPQITDLVIADNIIKCTATTVTSEGIGLLSINGLRITGNTVLNGLTSTVSGNANRYIENNFTSTFVAPTGLADHGARNRLQNYTVATLPAGVLGDEVIVTDAEAPTYLGIIAVGAGADVITPAFYDGTNWRAH